MTRARIVDVAARLLREQGPGAVTTRGVAEAAGVQAPTIYRLFGDKAGLLEAVAEHVMATYVSAKTEIADSASARDVPPVEDLRAAWTHPDRVRPGPPGGVPAAQRPGPGPTLTRGTLGSAGAGTPGAPPGREPPAAGK